MKIPHTEIKAMKFGQTSKWASLGVLAASMMLVSVSANAWNDKHQKGYEKRSYQAQRQHARQEYREDRREYLKDRREDRHEYREDRREYRADYADRAQQQLRLRQQARYQAQQSWRRGDYLPVAYHSPRYVVNDWRSQRLSAPPRGYEWRRVNDRFVQVSTGDHRIAHVW